MDTKKYIIEIPDNTAWLQWVKVSDKDGHVCFDFKDPEDLTPYTEPDLDAVKKEVHDKCMSEAEDLAYKLYSPKIDEAYQRGLNDAWDAVRKIVLDEKDGGLDVAAYHEIFGYGKSFCAVLKTFSASEAIEKIQQYEQEQEEIKVGDEVEMKCGVRPAIYMQGTKGSDEIYLLFSDGSCGVHSKSEIERKTGRHFHEIAEVIKTMQEKES